MPRNLHPSQAPPPPAIATARYVRASIGASPSSITPGTGCSARSLATEQDESRPAGDSYPLSLETRALSAGSFGRLPPRLFPRLLLRGGGSGFVRLALPASAE